MNRELGRGRRTGEEAERRDWGEGRGLGRRLKEGNGEREDWRGS